MHCRTCMIEWLLVALICFSGRVAGAQKAESNWGQWRGPVLTGVAPSARPPVTWSETRNVRWKTAIPGRGLSTPVVWNDLVFVTTSAESGDAIAPEKLEQMQQELPEWVRKRGARLPQAVHDFIILAVNRHTGQVVWQKTLRTALPISGLHKDASWASASPVTDGEVVVAHFGSMGTYCLDMQGTLLWTKDLGDMKTRASFGEGSSPALHGDHLVVNWDHEGDSFIIALNRKTGEKLWQQARDEITSWSTPLIVASEATAQVVVAASGRSRGYALTDGRILWALGGLTQNVIPSPVYGDGLVYLMSGFRGNALQAVRLGEAQGDITESPGQALAWTYDGKNTPYTPSPLLYGGLLYFCTANKATLSCFDAGTGKPGYEGQALESLNGVYASPVGADGRVYIVGRNGVTKVLAHGAEFKVLATNHLDDRFDASPAAVGDALFLRGEKALYCLADADR